MQRSLHQTRYHTLLFILCLLSGIPQSASAEETATGPLETKRVQPAIDRSIQYILKHCDTSGKFTYRTNPNSSIKYDNKYNLLRHAGTMYSLAMAYDSDPQPEIMDAMYRASLFLGMRIEPIKNHPEALAVWTDPVDMGHPSPRGIKTAKLGGAGLALVALASLEKQRPNTIPKDILTGLGAFIIFMQLENGDFHSKYAEPDGNAFFSEWRSLYYPGEAMLGLLCLNDLHPDPRWTDAVQRGLSYLAEIRKGAKDIPADHWALLATEKLLLMYDSLEKPSVSRETLLRHARAVCERMLNDQVLKDKEIAGCLHKYGMTCPTSIRLEGLLATYRILPDNDRNLKQRIARASHLGVDFLIQTQTEQGSLAGGIPRAARALPDTPKNRAFNARTEEIRIDYVQHALSAMIRYNHLFLTPTQEKHAGHP